MNNTDTVEIPDQPTESFKDWARAKYSELVKQINPCDEKGEMDPMRLNEVLIGFANHFSWAITIQEIESNALNIMQHDYESWHSRCYNEAYRLMREESGGAGRAPGQVTVEARIADMYGDELKKRQDELSNCKSRVDLLKGFMKVLEKQAGILQTLSSNMRSELFFANGVSISNNLSSDQKMKASKAALSQAIRGQISE
jgi:hypothetical protein